MLIKVICILLLTVAVRQTDADIASGRNSYLPPTEKGYSYDRPNVPFVPSKPPPPPPQKPYSPPSQPPPPPPQRQPAAYLPPPPPKGPGPVAPPRPQPPPQHTHDDHVHEPGMPFDFTYEVNDIESSNDYSHKAISDGDITRGEYRVQMPDGRVQVVRYTADWKNGYNADVSYE